MKKYVQELIDDIENNPKDWRPIKDEYGLFDGILASNGETYLSYYGNTKIFSVIRYYQGGIRYPLNWIECYRLERVVFKWLEQAGVHQLSRYVHLVDVKHHCEMPAVKPPAPGDE